MSSKLMQRQELFPRHNVSLKIHKCNFLFMRGIWKVAVQTEPGCRIRASPGSDTTIEIACEQA